MSRQDLEKQEGKNLLEKVENQINQLQQLNQLDLPRDYSASNALRGAWLVLQQTVDKDKKPVLESCSAISISQALFRMAIEGLSVTKSQGSFIPYGGVITWQREYAGTIALAKRYSDVIDCTANVIYEGDVFEYEIGPDGRKTIIKHEQKLENINITKIKGAYATVIRESCIDVEIMTIEQIKAAWAMSKSYPTPAHVKFPDRMCRKTVINRALNPYINSSDDSSLMETGREMNTAAMPENIEVVKPPMVSAGMDQEPEPEQIQTAEVVSEPAKAKAPF